MPLQLPLQRPLLAIPAACLLPALETSLVAFLSVARPYLGAQLQLFRLRRPPPPVLLLCSGPSPLLVLHPLCLPRSLRMLWRLPRPPLRRVCLVALPLRPPPLRPLLHLTLRQQRRLRQDHYLEARHRRREPRPRQVVFSENHRLPCRRRRLQRALLLRPIYLPLQQHHRRLPLLRRLHLPRRPASLAVRHPRLPHPHRLPHPRLLPPLLRARLVCLAASQPGLRHQQCRPHQL